MNRCWQELNPIDQVCQVEIQKRYITFFQIQLNILTQKNFWFHIISKLFDLNI